MKAKIYITLKNGVLDPQGKASLEALKNLGFSSFEDLRQGKFFEVKLKEQSKEEAESALKDACEKLLANTVIEDYSYEII